MFRFKWIAVGVIFLFLLPDLRAQPVGGSNSFVALVQGSVEVRRGANGAWAGAKLKDVLQGGDQLRTGERSRAEVYLASGTIIKLGALSDLEVPPTEEVSAKRGIFQIFNRDWMKGGSYRLPGAVAAIRGTEFQVEITEDGRFSLSVLDGEVSLTNQLGGVDLRTGDQGQWRPGMAPTRVALDLRDPKLVQWSFYYPAVLDPDELRLDGDLSASMAEYRAGDLPGASRAFPWGRPPATDPERGYRAQLLLTVGQVEEALGLLEAMGNESAVKGALLRLISAVRLEAPVRTNTPATSSQWLAESYARQAQGDLESARAAARRATELAPNLGFAWARLGELEFSFAERRAAERALESALNVAPRNAHAVALGGFILAAAGRIAQAEQEFSRAIELDNAYANAWLGRGLCRVRQSDEAGGQRDLFVAATLEPQRAVYRSYLGKAFQETGDRLHARQELELAKRLDPLDPTARLYAALLDHQENRVNESIRELEQAQSAGENRRIFRSQLLLDEDRAVRGANLAAIYRDAGLEDVSVREAAEAVRQDYANFSAHLFLANSYNGMRDESLGSLRYETATFSEYLMANLLAPVGGTPLSQQVSQQEYARLFDQDRAGFSSETTYLSSGQWQQALAQYGQFQNSAYALEGIYRAIPGDGPNAGLDERAFSVQAKQQLTPDDSVYLQAVYDHLKYGDVGQRYDPETTSRTLRNHEVQDPNVFAGWHHQWSPGAHTLLLLSSLRDEFVALEPKGRLNGLLTDGQGSVTNTMNGLFGGRGEAFDLRYESRFEAVGAELQQIWRTHRQTIVGGIRVQQGEVEARNQAGFRGDPFAGLHYATDLGPQGEITGQVEPRAETELQRLSGYTYWQWRVADPFTLLAGLSIDHAEFPSDIVSTLVSQEGREETRVSPKAGFTWTPHASSTVRGAYSQSLGGLFYDNSVRLEPVQIAGYNQVFRSLASESIAGIVPGTEFEAWDIGSEHRLASHTYFGWQAELLQSEGEQNLGVFSGNPTDFFTLAPSQIRQEIEYRERSFLAYIDQLLGEGWSIGARYRVTDSHFELNSPGISPAAWPEGSADRAALLHQVKLQAIYNHYSGWFTSIEALWNYQDNEKDDALLGSEEFWQLNCFAGYRFPRRRAEIALGLLNLTDQDYQLNPVNLYARLPRKRTLFTSLRLNF